MHSSCLPFVRTCVLCKNGHHGSKYKGCPYFRNLMENEMRTKPQSEKLNTKPNNRQPPDMDRARGPIQSIHSQRPTSKTFHEYPPLSPGKAWSRPLNFITTQLRSPPPQLQLNQSRDLPSKYMFVPHAEILVTLQARPAACP
jgi:hypothetical protein